VKTHERAVVTCLLGAFAALAGAFASGCGGVFYGLTVSSASSKLEAAQALGAQKYAPYEYYYAEEHLKEAMVQAAAADYGDALDLADEAERYADKAITLSRQAHEGGGR
jgi:uncharacterized protein DUF4398